MVPPPERRASVTGTTRHLETAMMLERAGVCRRARRFDAPALTAAVRAGPRSSSINSPICRASSTRPRSRRPSRQCSHPHRRHAQLSPRHRQRERIASSCRAFAFAYAPGGEPHPETDPLNLADPARAVTGEGRGRHGAAGARRSGFEGIVLRYGLLYGPGTWYATPERRRASTSMPPRRRRCSRSRAARRGVYNIADDDEGGLDRQGARRARFRPAFRLLNG